MALSGNLKTTLKNQQPQITAVEVEVGSGRGSYLIERARANPEIHFLGIEIKRQLVRWSRERAARLDLSNVEFVDLDARAVIMDFAAASVSVFHVYFPDPWFKRKHLKRRIISSDFIRLLHTQLIPGGLLEIATDDEDYFRHIQREILISEIVWTSTRQSLSERLFHPEIKTLFEEKYLAKRRQIHYLELGK